MDRAILQKKDDNEEDEEDNEEEWPLMIAASKVAQIVGLSPNFGGSTTLFDLVKASVYSGGRRGRRLLQKDQALLHSTATSTRNDSEQPSVYKLLHDCGSHGISVWKARKQGLRAATIGELSVCRKRLSSALHVLKEKNLLTSNHAERIRDELTRELQRSFGSRKESTARRLYEDRFCRKVQENNKNSFAWSWPRPEDSRYRNEYQWQAFCSLLSYPAVDVNNGKSADATKHETRNNRSWFTINGRIDGLAKNENAETVLVEIKCRTGDSRRGTAPPNYDILQTSIYMHMVPHVDQGEVVQCWLDARSETTALATHTVSLDAADGFHRQGFKTVVLPRLYMFAQCIHRIRSDQITRLRLLEASRDGASSGRETWQRSTLEMYAELAADLPFLSSRF